MSKRSNELTDNGNWMFVDTLALAMFEQGRVAKAIALEKKAIKLAGNDDRANEAKDALARFQAAAGVKADKQKVAKKQSEKKKSDKKKVTVKKVNTKKANITTTKPTTNTPKLWSNAC